MKRKFLATLVLLLLLLPLVSWYYLRSGLAWRKEAQSVMSGTALFPQTAFPDDAGKVISGEMLQDHVTLVAFVPCEADEDWDQLVGLLRDQFKDTGKANILLLDSCQAEPLPEALAGGMIHRIPCASSSGLCETLARDWPGDRSFALVDRKRVIRSYYAANTKEDKRILLEHMALLLPRERTDKVELKRGIQQ